MGDQYEWTFTTVFRCIVLSRGHHTTDPVLLRRSPYKFRHRHYLQLSTINHSNFYFYSLKHEEDRKRAGCELELWLNMQWSIGCHLSTICSLHSVDRVHQSLANAPQAQLEYFQSSHTLPDQHSQAPACSTDSVVRARPKRDSV